MLFNFPKVVSASLKYGIRSTLFVEQICLNMYRAFKHHCFKAFIEKRDTV